VRVVPLIIKSILGKYHKGNYAIFLLSSLQTDSKSQSVMGSHSQWQGGVLYMVNIAEALFLCEEGRVVFENRLHVRVLIMLSLVRH